MTLILFGPISTDGWPGPITSAFLIAVGVILLARAWAYYLRRDRSTERRDRSTEVSLISLIGLTAICILMIAVGIRGLAGKP